MKGRKYLLAVSLEEIAVLIAEGYCEIARPVGATAAEALAAMERDVAAGCLRAANRVALYLTTQINRAGHA